MTLEPSLKKCPVISRAPINVVVSEVEMQMQIIRFIPGDGPRGIFKPWKWMKAVLSGKAAQIAVEMSGAPSGNIKATLAARYMEAVGRRKS